MAESGVGAEMRSFTNAYDLAMSKLAYVMDVDDIARYGDIAKDLKMRKWQKDSSDELGRESRKARNWALGLGAATAGSAGVAAMFPEARKYAVPLALLTGIPAAGMAAGSAVLGKGKRMYDSRDDRTLDDYRRYINVDRHIRESRNT